MIRTHGLSLARAGSSFERTEIERRELRGRDVLIAIQFTGICRSDIHQGEGDWGRRLFPMVPGREIAGIVTAVGPHVLAYSVGDRVGVGGVIDSCRMCEYCLSGEEQYCKRGAVYTFNSLDDEGNPAYGGYSGQIVVDEEYVMRIPDAIALDEAAPLMGAGIAAYSPLKHWNAGPGMKVAIVGMGGLGHLAVQFARAMGANVTVFSRNDDKREDAIRFGAERFYAAYSPSVFTELSGSFDLIVNTASAKLDMDAYLSLLGVGGTFVNVGMPREPICCQTFSIQPRISISGSSLGGVRETQEMLEFCAEHHIIPRIQRIRADEMERAWDRVKRGDVRYRFVADMSTLLGPT
ncbi:NAD(P)-dependent alcohol dehydrogenase [Paenibacillus alkaliterrae]|uniref:NAD(P)-dependent alcohol dehydrogenase n=1 Tax=Paenibacillus alkaliterrae TaxID=320909 RepID=UPI001F476C5D|nr:NAD(P)-dependent alcohol dehydrogenase [Paenibacillus alkaliterrae]MCF2941370.1 NAD(P)-dependent alcohol dehydrogenase [Paenibacillus alkaliterrae]